MAQSELECAMRISDFLPHKLNRLSHRYNDEIVQLFLDDSGLSLHQWELLASLNEVGRATATELCSLVELDKVTVSRAISGLKKDRLVYFERDKQDRRKTHLTVSDDGKRLLNSILPKIEKRERDIRSVLSNAEQTQLNDMLNRLGMSLTPSDC